MQALISKGETDSFSLERKKKTPVSHILLIEKTNVPSEKNYGKPQLMIIHSSSKPSSLKFDLFFSWLKIFQNRKKKYFFGFSSHQHSTVLFGNISRFLYWVLACSKNVKES
jgi:hypothetical protein